MNNRVLFVKYLFNEYFNDSFEMFLIQQIKPATSKWLVLFVR